jgi:hypothetical protein
MPHISMEYAIMTPILIIQVILIPMATGWMTDVWVEQRRETALRDAGSHMGTTIQQLFFSLDREEIAAGITTQTANVPPFIESIPYIITASSTRVGNATLVDLYLALMGTNIAVSSRVTLGPNVLWEQSTLVSNSASASIQVQKFSNGTLGFSFGS